MDLFQQTCCLSLSWLCIVSATCISAGVTLFVGLPVPGCWLHLCDRLKPRANARNIVGQQDATLLGSTCCEHFHTMLCVVATCWKFDQFQTSSNNFQQVATTRNNTQHGVQTFATRWAQQCCERLHGALIADNLLPIIVDGQVAKGGRGQEETLHH